MTDSNLISLQPLIAERDRKLRHYQDLLKAKTPLYSGSKNISTIWPVYRCDNNEPIDEFVRLKTVSEALEGYFSQPEMKAAHPHGCGIMEIRHVHVTSPVRYMGKEISERLEETTEEALGLINEWKVLEYGSGDTAGSVAGVELFLRKLRRYDMHDLMHTTGLSRKAINDIIWGKVKPNSKTINTLTQALTMLENGYDNSWRKFTLEHLADILQCDEKRAKSLLNGLIPFTDEEKALLESWPARLAPYHIADLVLLTGLTDTAINTIKAGKTIPSVNTKIVLLQAIKTFNRTASKALVWRWCENEKLASLLDVPSNVVKLMKYGKHRFTAEQKEKLLVCSMEEAAYVIR